MTASDRSSLCKQFTKLDRTFGNCVCVKLGNRIRLWVHILMVDTKPESVCFINWCRCLSVGDDVGVVFCCLFKAVTTATCFHVCPFHASCFVDCLNHLIDWFVVVSDCFCTHCLSPLLVWLVISIGRIRRLCHRLHILCLGSQLRLASWCSTLSLMWWSSLLVD